MKKKICIFSALIVISFTGCANLETNSSTSNENKANIESEQTSELPVASESDKVKEEEVGYEGMTSLYADSLKDGEYKIKVDSSSSMFRITECILKVKDGNMSAEMTMSGTGYEYLYMGTATEACDSESEWIKYNEKDGVHSFTVPVEALDKEIDCAAFSKKKQLWYDRKLVFRADSLPVEAYKDGVVKTVDELSLTDGEYMTEVELSGGSGKASVKSPTKVSVKEGKAYARIEWSSNKYDYMIVNGEKYLPISTDTNSIFEIPVEAFDYSMPVLADTTAMSQPYEIEYTLKFSSAVTK